MTNIECLKYKIEQLENEVEFLNHELKRMGYRYMHLFTYLNEKDSELKFLDDEEIDSLIIETEEC